MKARDLSGEHIGADLTDAPPCPGRDHRYDPEPPPGRPVWCPSCTRQITTALTELANPTHTQHLPPGRLNTPRDETTSDHGKRAAYPSPSPAWDELDALIRWAVGWEDMVRAHAGEPLPARDRRHRYLTSALAYLQTRVTAALSMPDAAVFGKSVLYQRDRLIRSAGTGKLVVQIPGACPRCDTRGGLRRDDGSDYVKCRVCGVWWDRDHFDHLVRVLAQTEGLSG